MSFDSLENFEYYGVVGNGEGVSRALQGFWASSTGDCTIEVPSFELLGRPWLRMGNAGQMRRVFPTGGRATFGHVFQWRCNLLPFINNLYLLTSALDNSAATIFKVVVNTDGSVILVNGAGTTIGTSTGPVLTAGVTYTIQFQAVTHATLGTFEMRVNGVAVPGLTALTNLVMPGTITQYSFDRGASGAAPHEVYYKFSCPYSLAGTYNSSWPKVTRVTSTTLNADTAANTWTPRPRANFGIGVTYVPGDGNVLDCGTSANFNLGIAPFTLETQFRFSVLPTGSQAQTILGKWSASTNNRSYRLVKYGPTANAGNVQFEISTDGTQPGVVTVFSLPWSPVVGHAYQLAVSRAGGITRFFVDGVLLGSSAGFPDTNTYFASGTNSKFTVGGEISGVGTTVTPATSPNAIYDEIRITVGVGRYTTTYAKQAAAWPRTIGGDASFASVQLLIGADTALIDESTTLVKTIAGLGLAARLVPGDTPGLWPTLSTLDSIDDRYLEAAFLPASNVLQFTVIPTNGQQVVIGSTTYTFNTVLGAANSVLIGASLLTALANLQAAVVLGPGIGTLYGTGTTANAQAQAVLGPQSGQMTATAIVAGTAGNAYASTTTVTSATWANGATFTGGVNIPAFVEFTFSPPPPEATGLRAVFLVDRSYVDADTASIRKSFNVSGSVAAGADNVLTNTPTYRGDLIEQDPATAAGLTPTSIVNGKLRLTRTT